MAEDTNPTILRSEGSSSENDDVRALAKSSRSSDYEDFRESKALEANISDPRNVIFTKTPIILKEESDRGSRIPQGAVDIDLKHSIITILNRRLRLRNFIICIGDISEAMKNSTSCRFLKSLTVLGAEGVGCV